MEYVCYRHQDLLIRDDSAIEVTLRSALTEDLVVREWTDNKRNSARK